MHARMQRTFDLDSFMSELGSWSIPQIVPICWVLSLLCPLEAFPLCPLNHNSTMVIKFVMIHL